MAKPNGTHLGPTLCSAEGVPVTPSGAVGRSKASIFPLSHSLYAWLSGELATLIPWTNGGLSTLALNLLGSTLE